MPRRSTKERHPTTGILFFTLSLSLSLAVAEAIARTALAPPLHSAAGVWSPLQDRARTDYFVPDPEIGYAPGPGWARDGRFGYQNGAELESRPRPRGEIAVIGDSLVQDLGLKRSLDEIFADDSVHVWNAGIGGYNTRQEAVYLRTRITRTPGVVVLVFCPNDFAYPMIVVDSGKSHEMKYHLEHVLEASPRLVRLSAFYRLFVHARLSYLGRVSISPESVAANHAEVERGLREIADITESRNAKLRVLVYPYLAEHSEGRWWTIARGLALETMERLGLEYLDLHEAFASAGLRELRDEPSDAIHPSIEGHRIAARLLVERFAEDLPPRAPFPHIGPLP